jgi:nucleoside-diphosphate-sugar epimerase
MKRILILGGGLFCGRVFALGLSGNEEYELHVVNRGHYPLKLGGVREFRCDRREARMLARILPPGEYDALVDFCATEPGDAAPVARALAGRIRQYVLLSCASVYGSRAGEASTESSPAGGALSADASKKLALELELAEACNDAGVPYTILRPAAIYGELNYARREPWIVELIARRHAVPYPLDATAVWSSVYVRDVANAVLRVIGDERAHNAAFNLASPERVTYARLISDFERYNGGAFETREITAAELEAEDGGFPFPVTEDSLTDGSLFSRTFGFRYTPFADAMERTFHAFYRLYN